MVPAAKSSEIERTFPMRKSANPTRSKAVDDPSKVERRVMCTNYERCLDEAIERNWVGFTCRHCLSFEPLTLDPIEWLADSLACSALVYVSEFPSALKQKTRGSIILGLQRRRSKESVFAST